MNEAPAIHKRDASAPAADGAVLLHVWSVDPDKADDHVRSLSQLFSRIAAEPGLISSRVLESPDRASIASLLEMHSVEDRDRLEQLPEVRDTLHHLHGAANLVVRLYHVTGAFRA